MDWTKDKDEITRAYLIATNANNLELFRIIGENINQIKKEYPLIEFVFERLNAVNALIINEQVWDADIVLRSALETLVKFVFIADADDLERPQLLNEFWNDLSEIYTIKLSEQSKKNLKHTSESKIHKLAYSPMVLDEKNEERLRQKWPKSTRSQLEQKWSFSAIVNYITQKNKDNPLKSFEFITHSYRMASHITHGDEIGINIIRERNSRVENERTAVHRAHYLRLLSDIYYYSVLAAIYTMKLLKQNSSFFFELAKSLDDVNLLINKYHNIPFEDSMYDRFRS